MLSESDDDFGAASRGLAICASIAVGRVGRDHVPTAVRLASLAHEQPQQGGSGNIAGHHRRHPNSGILPWQYCGRADGRSVLRIP